MLRATIVAVAALLSVALAGCGHRVAATAPPNAGADLATYVMDTGTSPTGDGLGGIGAGAGGTAPGAGGTAPGASAGAGGTAPGAGAPTSPRPDCPTAQKAYQVLAFLVSADTGTPVRQIVQDLRAGRSLDDIAGARSGQVKAEALSLVNAWLQFAEANGKLTAAQVEQARGWSALAIDALMAANVSACVPATS